MTVEKIRKRKCRSFVRIDTSWVSCKAESGHKGDHYYTGVSDDKVPKPLRVEWHTFD